MDPVLFVLVTLGDTSGGDDRLAGNRLFLVADGTEFEPREGAGYRPSLTLPVYYKIMYQKSKEIDSGLIQEFKSLLGNCNRIFVYRKSSFYGCGSLLFKKKRKKSMQFITTCKAQEFM